MAISTEKNIVSPQEIKAGKPVTASTLQKLASNVNRLRPLALGDDFPGGSSTIAAHDHDSLGGVRVPLYDVHLLGQMLPRQDANYCGSMSSPEPLRLRVLSSMNSSDNIVETLATDLEVFSFGNTKNGFNVSGHGLGIGDADWCVLSSMPGRHLMPGDSREWSLQIDSETTQELTWVWTYTATQDEPGSSHTASFYRFRIPDSGANDSLRIKLPAWAREIEFVFPLHFSIEVNAFNAEHDIRKIRDASNMFDQWMLKLRASCGESDGAWLKLSPYPRAGINAPPLRHLLMDVSQIAGTEQAFCIEYEVNSEICGDPDHLLYPYAQLQYFSLWSQWPDSYECDPPYVYAIVKA